MGGDEEGRQEIGLFRYALVRDVADPALSKAERGRLVRALSDREHVGPDGRLVRVARATLDEWIRAYRRGGFQALVPRPRVVAPRTPAGMLELAFRLKRERPERTAAQVRQIMLTTAGEGDQVPGLRTLQTHLARAGLNVRADGRSPGKVYGRFEAGAAAPRSPGRTFVLARRRPTARRESLASLLAAPEPQGAGCWASRSSRLLLVSADVVVR